jgi:hypothetical protein
MFLHSTPTAPGADGFAQGLSEGHEDVVDGNPPFGREFFPEGHFRGIRIFSVYVSETVGNPVHVGVHAYAGFPIPQRDDEVGCLAAHTGELEEFIQIIGNAAAVLVDEDTTYRSNVFCLCLIEADRIDEFLYFPGREFQHGPGRVGLGKEASR